ncbi:MAG TPA: YceI family protein [Actinomycetota bacterium]|nr:YceI family protein [Actinomycetota bacterium]
MTTATQQIEQGAGLAAGTWVLDPAHSTIGFVSRHMMVAKVRGRFGEFEAAIHVEDDLDRSWAEASIVAASLDTGNEQRDGHLKSPDFLDVERFPRLTFRSTSVEHVDGPRWRIRGDLAIRDITLPVELDAELNGTDVNPWGREVAFFSAAGEFDREDYGMVWNQALESGGVLVGKKVQLEIEGEAIRQ